MKKRWVILVAQVVRGKSRAPERNAQTGPKWKRHKPYKYYDGSKDHEILYTKSFTSTEEDAVAEAKRIDDAMFGTYIQGMGKTDVFCVSHYKIILHDASDNETQDIGGTIEAREGQLWNNRDSSSVSNQRLRGWGVIPYDPSDASYQILESKKRPI